MSILNLHEILMWVDFPAIVEMYEDAYVGDR